MMCYDRCGLKESLLTNVKFPTFGSNGKGTAQQTLQTQVVKHNTALVRN